PDAAAGKDLAGADVQVVAGRVGVLGPLVPKVDAEVGLVGRLVLRETCVPVDTEERAAARPRVGAEVGADLLEPRRDSVDEGESRIEQLLLVALLVRREPVPVVVRPQVGEKREQSGTERGPCCRLCHGLTLEGSVRSNRRLSPRASRSCSQTFPAGA